jgi:HEAT repeat protein
MSDVYLGINPRSREKQAFKFFPKSASIRPFAYGRFVRDMNVLRSLSHPGILKVIDNGVFDNCCYYSMEFVPGGDLARRLERGKLPVEEATNLFTGVCRAMAYAHEQGVIHGNLKPSNILINANREPVISDFKTSWRPDFQSNGMTRSCKSLETIAYVAPEQRCSAKNRNRRADVFALGAILYHMLMDFPPLGDFPKPTDQQWDFPETISSALQKCMSSDPDQRFEDAGSLLAHLEGLPVYAPVRTWSTGFQPEFKASLSAEEGMASAVKTDRVEAWFKVLRAGTSRERLAIVREMVETLTPAEAKTIVKIYAEEGDRVRWGLIRVLGELKVEAATQLILNDMNGSFYTECAIEALGKIGSSEAYNPIRDFIANNPDRAEIALLPLAKTGKKRAIKTLEQYLSHDSPVTRAAAVQALEAIECPEALALLKEQLCVEGDEKVRSILIQAVHALQRTLHPALRTSLNEAVAMVRSTGA